MSGGSKAHGRSGMTGVGFEGGIDLSRMSWVSIEHKNCTLGRTVQRSSKAIISSYLELVVGFSFGARRDMRTASRRMVSIASWSSLVYPMMKMNEVEDDVSWSMNKFKTRWRAESDRSKKKVAAVGFWILEFETRRRWGNRPPQHSELETIPSHFNHIAPDKILTKSYTVADPPRYLRYFNIQLCQTSVTKIHASDGAVVYPPQPAMSPPPQTCGLSPASPYSLGVEVHRGAGVGVFGSGPSLIVWY